MCTPAAFVDFVPADQHLRPSVVPRCSRLSDYKPDEQDQRLRLALHERDQLRCVDWLDPVGDNCVRCWYDSCGRFR